MSVVESLTRVADADVDGGRGVRRSNAGTVGPVGWLIDTATICKKGEHCAALEHSLHFTVFTCSPPPAPRSGSPAPTPKLQYRFVTFVISLFTKSYQRNSVHGPRLAELPLTQCDI